MKIITEEDFNRAKEQENYWKIVEKLAFKQKIRMASLHKHYIRNRKFQGVSHVDWSSLTLHGKKVK